MMKREKYWLMIGPSLQARGGMTSVVQAYQAAGLFDGAQVRYLSSYHGREALARLWIYLACMTRLLHALLLGRVAGVHLHSASRGSFWRKASMAWLARLFGVPYLFHIHSGEFLVFYREGCGPRAQRMVAGTLRRASRVIVLAASWQRDFDQAIPGLKLVVVNNPIDVPAGLPAGRSPVPSVLFLGRIRDKKGVFDLLEAMVAVHRAIPAARLVLAGDGEVERARARAVELGLGDVVQLPGWIDGDAKFEALRQSWVMALPSYFEGFPIGVLEAMAMGSLVVATRVGGIPDVIRHGENGLLLQPGDVAQLAAALEVGLTDSARRMDMADVARRDAQAYDCRQVVAALRALYRQVNPAVEWSA